MYSKASPWNWFVAALADDDHLAAHGHAIVGAEIVGNDAVFLDAIHPQCRAAFRSGGATQAGSPLARRRWSYHSSGSGRHSS